MTIGIKIFAIFNEARTQNELPAPELDVEIM
jgi:hypothetical protein